MEDITFIIKTFERKRCLRRLINSILVKYPNAAILVADDSEVSCKSYYEQSKYYNNVKVFELSKDCGLSAGRNYLLDRVETKYFMLLDDDFVFDKYTNIDRAIELLKEKEVDILGGYIRNYVPINNLYTFFKCLIQTILRYSKPANYLGTMDYNSDTKTLTVNYIRKQFPVYTDTELVLNFFVAKTDIIRDKNRWDDELKLQEHTAFFYTAKKQGLKIGFSNEFSVQHKPIKTKSYNSYRERNFVQLFMKKNGIETIISNYDDGPTIITKNDETI